MIPVYRWDVSVVPLEGLKFLKSGFHLKFLKNNRICGASLGYHCSYEEW
jgi:hypothetical protein